MNPEHFDAPAESSDPHISDEPAQLSAELTAGEPDNAERLEVEQQIDTTTLEIAAVLEEATEDCTMHEVPDPAPTTKKTSPAISPTVSTDRSLGEPDETPKKDGQAEASLAPESEDGQPATTASGGGAQKPPSQNETALGDDNENDQGPDEQSEVEIVETIALDTPEAVRTRCLEEVEQAVAELETGKADDHPELGDYDLMGWTIAGLADEAAEEGDREKTEAYIDTLAHYSSTAPTNQLAAACYSGLKVNSERSAETLHDILAAQKSREPTSLYDTQGKALETIIAESEANDTPPTSWIEQYAHDKEEAWTLQLDYHHRQAERGGPDAAMHQEACNAKAAELVEPGKYEPQTIYNQTPRALSVTDDLATRTAIIEGFVENQQPVPLTLRTLDHYIGIGHEVLSDPGLATKRNVEAFKRGIENLTQQIGEINPDEFELTAAQLTWKASLTMHYDKTPQAVISQLDETITGLFEHVMPDNSESTADDIRKRHEGIAYIRDGTLRFQATQAARAGDFGAAQHFLLHIGNSRNQETTLTACLKHAKTAEQITRLKPNEMSAIINPALALRFQANEAWANGDIETSVRLSRESALTIAEGDVNIKLDTIEATYKMIQAEDNAKATTFAKEMLAELRANAHPKQSPFNFLFLSDALIRAGDPDEPRIVYQEIEHSPGDTTQRLFRKLQLAKALRQT